MLTAHIRHWPVCSVPPCTLPGAAAGWGCTGGHTPGTRDWTLASQRARSGQHYAGTRGQTRSCWRWWCLDSWQINVFSLDSSSHILPGLNVSRLKTEKNAAGTDNLVQRLSRNCWYSSPSPAMIIQYRRGDGDRGEGWWSVMYMVFDEVWSTLNLIEVLSSYLPNTLSTQCFIY